MNDLNRKNSLSLSYDLSKRGFCLEFLRGD